MAIPMCALSGMQMIATGRSPDGGSCGTAERRASPQRGKKTDVPASYIYQNKRAAGTAGIKSNPNVRRGVVAQRARICAYMGKVTELVPAVPADLVFSMAGLRGRSKPSGTRWAMLPRRPRKYRAVSNPTESFCARNRALPQGVRRHRVHQKSHGTSSGS